VLLSLAILYQHRGELEDAFTHYQQALEIQREVGWRSGEGCSLSNLGELLLLRGEPSAAAAHFEHAIAICDEVVPFAAAGCRASLALLRAQDGAFDEARTLLVRAEPELRGVYPLELGRFLCRKAQVEHLADDSSAANAALSEAEEIAEEILAGPGSELAQAIADVRGLLGLPDQSSP
jgi:tetratricopeptide (TPR) repeat protein